MPLVIGDAAGQLFELGVDLVQVLDHLVDGIIAADEGGAEHFVPGPHAVIGLLSDDDPDLRLSVLLEACQRVLRHFHLLWNGRVPDRIRPTGDFSAAIGLAVGVQRRVF